MRVVLPSEIPLNLRGLGVVFNSKAIIPKRFFITRTHTHAHTVTDMSLNKGSQWVITTPENCLNKKCPCAEISLNT